MQVALTHLCKPQRNGKNICIDIHLSCQERDATAGGEIEIDDASAAPAPVHITGPDIAIGENLLNDGDMAKTIGSLSPGL